MSPSVSPDPAAVAAYFDSASSEPLHPAARQTLLAALEQGYADPRRLHHPGRSARLLLDNAREVVAECLGTRPDEVVFTPSGTHAVHLGLLGLHRGRRRTGRRLLVSAVEHSSVLHAAQWTGDPVTELPVTATGAVRADALAAAVGPTDDGEGVSVAAVQTANHEVGTRQPVAAVAERLSAAGVPWFADACASGGREDLPKGWSAAALSAHKWGGPAGVGVLLVRKRAPWRQPLPGDDRTDERAVGFENVPAALAAAAALQAVLTERDEVALRQRELIDRLRSRLPELLDDIDVVGDPDDRLPHLLTFSCLYVDGEALVTELDRRGYGVASGSACTASTLTPSRVLAAMGALTHGNVRLSVTRDTTPEQIDAFAGTVADVVAGLRGTLDL